MASELLALVVRFGVFLAALALLPRRIATFSAHAALGAALLLLALPALNFDTTSGAGALASFYQAPLSFDLRVVLLESVVGLLLAVAASMAAYGARIGARWISLSACSGYFDAENRGASPSLEPQLQRIEYLFMLVFVAALFSSPGLVAQVMNFCADSLAPSTMRGVFSGDGSVLAGALAYIGSSAFSLALMFALPAFVIVLSVSLCGVLLSRLVPRAASTPLVSSIIFSLVLFVFSLCLYPFAASVEPNVGKSTSADFVNDALGMRGGTSQ